MGKSSRKWMRVSLEGGKRSAGSPRKEKRARATFDKKTAKLMKRYPAETAEALRRIEARENKR